MLFFCNHSLIHQSIGILMSDAYWRYAAESRQAPSSIAGKRSRSDYGICLPFLLVRVFISPSQFTFLFRDSSLASLLYSLSKSRFKAFTHLSPFQFEFCLRISFLARHVKHKACSFFCWIDCMPRVFENSNCALNQSLFYNVHTSIINE